MQQPVTHLRQFLIMGHDQEGLLKFLTQLKEQLVQLPRIGGIEVPRRFIGKDHVRPIDQRPRHRHPLLLPARQGIGLILQPVTDPQRV